jgi:hypothetical protein
VFPRRAHAFPMPLQGVQTGGVIMVCKTCGQAACKTYEQTATVLHMTLLTTHKTSLQCMVTRQDGATLQTIVTNKFNSTMNSVIDTTIHTSPVDIGCYTPTARTT